MNSHWYMPGAAGMQFCWNKEPSYECPHGFQRWDIIDLASGAVVAENIVREPERAGITHRRHVAPEAKQAAALLGIDAEKLVQMLYRAHRGFTRARVNGKLTDRCDACGHRMKRLGFRCWIERPATPAEINTGDEISRRVFGGEPTRIVKSFYMDTKREAESWAREEAKISKAAAADTKE